MRKSKRIIKRNILFFWISCFIIILSVVLAIGYFNNTWRFSSNVQMYDATFCQIEDDEIKVPIEKISITYLESQNIGFCGSFSTGNDISVELGIYIYKDEAEGDLQPPVFFNEVGEKFSTGSFFYPLPEAVFQESGIYRLDIYFGRKIIASEYLEVMN